MKLMIINFLSIIIFIFFNYLIFNSKSIKIQIKLYSIKYKIYDMIKNYSK